MAEANGKAYRLKHGGMVTIRDLEGREELERRFPRRYKVAETEIERAWFAPPSLIFEERGGSGRFTEYSFDKSDGSRKLIREIIVALRVYRARERSAEPEKGPGSSGVPPVAVAIWPVAPKPDEKDVPPIWYRLTQDLKV